MLRIHLFGPPRFERDGLPILISRRKGVAMLSYLTQRTQPASRETLAAMFWPEHGHTEALKSFRRELSRLKQSLGPACLETVSSQLAVNTNVVVDTIRFQQQLSLVREHGHFPQRECASCLDALHEATNLYTDVFMAGFNLRDCTEFDEWQNQHRENLRQELGYALHHLTHWYLSQRCEDQAIDYCRRWLALDPLNETVHRLLMQAHAQAGRPAEALRVYEEGTKLLKEELGIGSAEETRQLAQKIRTGTFLRSGQVSIPHGSMDQRDVSPIRRRRSNLPQQPTPFIGRQQELMMIQLRLQEAACHLLTLIGPGGIGKTRLALKVGQRILEDNNSLFVDGVLFVPLASARTSAEIVSAILEAVASPFYKDMPSTDVLLDFLRDRKLLLILDNMEHLLKGSEIVAAILANAPGVRILATSRVALRLQAEWFHPVGGMSCPPGKLHIENQARNGDLDQLRKYDAVQLFEQCARNASPNFRLSEQLEPVIQICRLVDGMPLALELAAAWIKVMATSAIADELKQNLDLLASRFGNMPDRHRSIRIVFKQTWALLSPNEQDVLARLSVFRGGFTREAAFEVAGADLFLLSDMIEKALLTTTTHGRYRLHELLRQFAFEKLQGMKWVDESRAVHCQYYMSLLAKLEPALKGDQQPEALNQIKACLENIRLAWQYALEGPDLNVLSAALETIYLYFFISGRNQEGVDFLQPACLILSPKKDEKPKQVWGRIMSRICLFKTHLPSDARIKTEIQTARSVASLYHDEAEVAYCSFVQGVIHTLMEEDAAAAIRANEQALKVFRSRNDMFYLVQVLIWLGFSHGNNSRLDLFYEYNRQAFDLARVAGHRAGALNALGNLVAWAFCTGNYATAEQFAQEVGIDAAELDLPNMIAHSKAQLCLAYFLRGEIERSGELSREAYALALEIHLPLSIAYSLTFLALHAVIDGDYLLAKMQGEESLATPAPRFSMIMAHWALALACTGLAQDEAAWDHVRAMLEMARQAGFHAMATWPLPVIGALSARAGQLERAVKLLALAQSHPQSPTGWQGKWPLLGKMLGSLRSDLGEKKFEAAWQQGQALDLEGVITETLDYQGDTPGPSR